jgi:uncharacterized protein YjbI with pentapeptide repeats
LLATADTFTFSGDGGDVELKGISDPTASNSAATKSYVDGLSTGLSWQAPCRVATTVAGTLATSFEDGDTVDGVVLATGDCILIKDQATASENGKYEVQASGAPIRSTGMEATDSVASYAIFISEGTANGDQAYVVTNDSGSDVVGTDDLVFVQFTALGQITAGTGLSKDGSTLNANVDGTTIEITGGNAIGVKDNGITTAKILDDNVTTAKILDANVTTAKILDANVTNAKMALLSVDTGNLIDDAVTTAKITDANITTAKILDANVTNAKLALLSVDTGNLIDDAVTTAKITDANVTNAKLANSGVTVSAGDGMTITGGSLSLGGTVTIAARPDEITLTNAVGKIAVKPAGIANLHMGLLSVDTGNLIDDAVTTAKIADANVTTAKILDDNITTAKILDANITTAKILDANVTNAKLANSSITVTAGDGMSTTGASISLGGSETISVDSTVVRTSTAQSIAGIKTFTDTTQSTSITTGATIVAGGVGVTKDMYVGGSSFAFKFTATSDARKKTDIMPMSDTSAVIKEMNPVSYKWIESDKDDHVKAGLIAQELLNTAPDAVYMDSDGAYSVDYNHIFSMMLKSHQELMARVESLENQLNAQ